MDSEAFDEFAKRYGANIIQARRMAIPAMSSQRGVTLPSNIASQAKANVGDVLDEITFFMLLTVNSLILEVDLVQDCQVSPPLQRTAKSTVVCLRQ